MTLRLIPSVPFVRAFVGPWAYCALVLAGLASPAQAQRVDLRIPEPLRFTEHLADCVRDITGADRPVNTDEARAFVRQKVKVNPDLWAKAMSACEAYAHVVVEGEKFNVGIAPLPTSAEVQALATNIANLQEAQRVKFEDMAARLQKNLALALVCASAPASAERTKICDALTK